MSSARRSRGSCLASSSFSSSPGCMHLSMMAKGPAVAPSAQFRVESSEWRLSSRRPGRRRRRPRAARARRARARPRSASRRRRSRVAAPARVSRRAGPSTGASPNFDRLGDAAVGVADRAQLAGQADLAEAGERPAVGVGERLAPVRRGERQRDREVGAGLVDPDPAGDVDEDVGARRATARRGGRARRAPSPAGCGRCPLATRRGGTISVGATSAWTSTSSGRVPSIEQSTTEPGAALASPTNRAEGSATSTRPPERISNTPTSLVAPKRFLSARRVRKLRSRSPSKRSTQSTRCSSTRGPATAPSLVTWPTRITAQSEPLRHLHHRAGRLAHLPDRARRPGHALGVQGLDRVDHAGLRALGLERREHRLERGLGERRDGERALAEPLGAQPHLRRRLLAGDVERRSRAGGAEVAERHPGQGATCRSRASRRAGPASPGTRPPPSTRSSSAIPVVEPRRPRGPRPRAAATGARPGAAPRADAAPAPACAGSARGASTSVFHSPQPGAAARPGERLVPTRLAEEGGGRTRHRADRTDGRRRLNAASCR